uniref:UDP-glycosyltransferase 73B5 n=1 Tax=Anthurium amnicola TaxID=1678845 RepID=A0A1D1Y162_9ARAE
MVRSELPNFLRDPMDRNPHAKNLDNLKRAQSECFGVVVNSFYELHPAYCDLFRQTECQRAWFCGPYTAWPRTEDDEEEDAAASKGDRSSWMAWLDEQATASVVYVGFGSFIYFTKQQHWEMARGLEASGRPFLWVLKESEFAGGGEGWLPEGFEERMGESGRGLLVRNWAPQPEILSHGSTAAFLTHCGWNSVLEGLVSGVPLIGWPMAAEQFYNSKMLEEELGVSVELARGPVAEVSSPEVASVVRQVIAGERGEDMRRRAATCSDMIRAATQEGDHKPGASIKALDDFLEEAASARRATTATRPAARKK